MSEENKIDMINKPSHYNFGEIQAYEFIVYQGLDYIAGNIIKYIVRYRHKNTPIEDLNKAKMYLELFMEIKKINSVFAETEKKFAYFTTPEHKEITVDEYIKDQDFGPIASNIIQAICNFNAMPFDIGMSALFHAYCDLQNLTAKVEGELILEDCIKVTESQFFKVFDLKVDDEVQVTTKYQAMFEGEYKCFERVGVLKKIISVETGIVFVKWNHGAVESIHAEWLEKVKVNDE